MNTSTSGSSMIFESRMNNYTRWQVMMGDGVVETGSNVGNDFRIRRFDDTGAGLGDAVNINRATGAVSIPNLSAPQYLPLTGGTLTGLLTTNNNFMLNTAGGGAQSVIFSRIANVDRWRIYTNTGGTESGGNVGSDIAINRYADDGTYLSQPFSITRATGAVTIPNLQGYLPLAGGTLTGNLTGTNVTITGAYATPNVTITGANIIIDRTVASPGTIGSSIRGRYQGGERWIMALGNMDQETGSNAGSNFTLNYYSDAGTVLGNALTIIRATGQVVIPTLAGNIDNVSASYSLVPADSGRIKFVNAATPITITIPSTILGGFYCTVIQGGVGIVSFAAGTGVTLSNRQSQFRSAGQNALCSLVMVATNCILGGDTQT
jgi:hypothetical protein